MIGKLKTSTLDLVQLVRDSMAQREGVQADALMPFATVRSLFGMRERAWFNSASNYKDAVAQIFAAADTVREKAQATGQQSASPRRQLLPSGNTTLVSFIESPFTTKVAWQAYAALPTERERAAALKAARSDAVSAASGGSAYPLQSPLAA